MNPNFISVKDLLASGVHFGHKVSRWNPKMAPYIYGKKNLIHIIDIRATLKGLIKACEFLRNVTKRGELILFVGTKRQASALVAQEAKRCGMPYASDRWLGGALTNYATIRERLRSLQEIEQMEQDGSISRYTKKEISNIMREKRKLRRNLEGLRTMDRLPAVMVIIDPVYERIAVEEAHKISAATVALIDTDGDPDLIDVSIPGNDDSLKVIQLIMSKLADAVLEGRAQSIGAVVGAAKPEPAAHVEQTAS